MCSSSSSTQKMVLFHSLLLGFCIAAATASVTISSNSTSLTPLGENATFSCTGDTYSPFQTFVVEDEAGDRLVSIVQDDNIILQERHIIFEESQDEITLHVLATAENNNSIIQCRDNLPHPVFSAELQVTVIGPPLPPTISSTVVSATELVLEWEQPFSWPGHDVLRYVITEFNVETRTSRTYMYNTTDLAHSYSSSDGEIMKRCENITFTVSAVSDLGPSEQSTLTTGLPVALTSFGEINPVVRFTQAGIPEVNVTLEPPPLCDYQSAVLVLVLELIDGKGETLPSMMQAYSAHPATLSVFYLMDLTPNANYTLILTVSTIAGNASASIIFDTQQPNSFSPILGLLGPVIGSVAGFLVIVVAIMFIAVCCAAVHWRSKSLSQERSVAQDNGHQRDSIYQYIDDYETIASASKNQYLTHSSPGNQRPRPESPYQDMNSAKLEPPTGQSRSLPPPTQFSFTSNGQLPNNDVYVTPGGSVVFRPQQGPACQAGEEDYTAMRSLDLPATVPENAMPYNTQPNKY